MRRKGNKERKENISVTDCKAENTNLSCLRV